MNLLAILLILVFVFLLASRRSGKGMAFGKIFMWALLGWVVFLYIVPLLAGVNTPWPEFYEVLIVVLVAAITAAVAKLLIRVASRFKSSRN